VRFGSLFAGIGGFDLGLERAGMTCAWQVENDPYATRVLAKHWPDVKRYGDIREVDWSEVERVDLICGGFPCQDISSAGGKAGIGGERSGLWLEFVRCIREVRPRYVVVENVSALLGRGLGDVLGDLASLRYGAEWACLQACDFGLPQGRDRVWIVADADGWGREAGEKCNRPRPRFALRPDHDGLALAQRRKRDALSHIRRMDDGLPGGLDRLRVLGNAVVPQVAEFLGRAILAASATSEPPPPLRSGSVSA
jgi:DNA (cytosine-5)-methyltransferase 1